MDPIIGGALIGGGMNMAGGLIGQIMYGKRRQHAENREDTAVRRRAQDMEAAGLSKTLAAGGGASSAASQPPAPTNPLGDVDPMMIGNALSTRAGITKTEADSKVAEQTAKNAKKTATILDEQLKHAQDTTARLDHDRKIWSDSEMRTDANTQWRDIEALVKTLAESQGLPTSLTGVSGAVTGAVQDTAKKAKTGILNILTPESPTGDQPNHEAWIRPTRESRAQLGEFLRKHTQLSQRQRAHALDNYGHIDNYLQFYRQPDIQQLGR